MILFKSLVWADDDYSFKQGEKRMVILGHFCWLWIQRHQFHLCPEFSFSFFFAHFSMWHHFVLFNKGLLKKSHIFLTFSRNKVHIAIDKIWIRHMNFATRIVSRLKCRRRKSYSGRHVCVKKHKHNESYLFIYFSKQCNAKKKKDSVCSGTDFFFFIIVSFVYSGLQHRIVLNHYLLQTANNSSVIKLLKQNWRQAL